MLAEDAGLADLPEEEGKNRCYERAMREILDGIKRDLADFRVEHQHWFSEKTLVEGGKVAAANIDAYLGFDHKISCDVEIPPAHFTNTPPCGRVNLKSNCTPDCKGNFSLVVDGMSLEEARQESSRCLRCDHFGYGSFKGGRNTEW